MRSILGLALLASAAPAAFAEGEFSGNIAYTTDYIFRGYSQTLEEPTVQGGFDWASEKFYAGTWASRVDFGVEAPMEVDFYGGFTPSVGPVALDIGMIGYFYPGSTDDFGDFDYIEGYVGASYAPVEPLEIGAKVFYTPEWSLDGGDGWYYEASSAYALNEHVGFSGVLGYQTVETEGWFAMRTNDYATWNAGVTFSFSGFDFDVRYHDTSVDDDVMDDRVTATLSRAL